MSLAGFMAKCKCHGGHPATKSTTPKCNFENDGKIQCDRCSSGYFMVKKGTIGNGGYRLCFARKFFGGTSSVDDERMLIVFALQ